MSIRNFLYGQFRRYVSTQIQTAPAGQLSLLLSEFASTQHVSSIHKVYPTLKPLAGPYKSPNVIPHDTQPRGSPLGDELTRVLKALANSGHPPDLQRIDQILADMPKLFYIRPTMHTHSQILQVFAKQKNTASLMRWLQNVKYKPPHNPPTLALFHSVLQNCKQYMNINQLRNVVKSMRRAGCKPTNETYMILLRSLVDTTEIFSTPPSLSSLENVIGDIKIQNLPYDPVIAELITAAFSNRGMTDQAEHLLKLYLDSVPVPLSAQQQLERTWCTSMSDAAHSGGVEKALQVYDNFLKEGGSPTENVMKAVLRHSTAMSDLEHVERVLQVQATGMHLALLIANNMRLGRLLIATNIYDESKRRRIPPIAPIVGPLIRGLCQHKVPPESYLDQALEIYKTSLEAFPQPSATQKSTFVHSTGPDLDMFKSLFRGISLSPNLQKYTPIALSLIHDMKAQNISVSPIIAYTIIILMRNAPNEDMAFDAYKKFYTELNVEGYIAVLDAFCTLPFTSTSGDQYRVPSPHLYFQMVQDMRDRRLEITQVVYTILLRQVGDLAARATKMYEPGDENLIAILARLLRVTRRTHDLITLDASITPDTHLYNQLLNTYQRMGEFTETLRVWDQMYMSGNYDHVSVSIVLDACAWSFGTKQAFSIVNNLSKDEFKFNQHNWDTWVECLCRLGRMNDAVKVVCLQMGREQPGVAPKPETIRILLFFARRFGVEGEVIGRVQGYLPKLWSTLPDDIRG